MEDYVDACVDALQVIIDQVGGIEKIKAMGIGAPNGNFYNGTIEFAPNLAWAHDGVVPLAKMFSERLNNIPVGLTNDANAAAVGEMIYGVARGMKNFIVLTLGTGVGSGIVINGQLVYGCDGFAGELGHVIMRRENGRLVDVVEMAVSRLIVQQQVLHVPHENCSPPLRSLRCFVRWIPRRLPLSMCRLQLAKATNWPRISTNSPEQCLVRPALI